MAFALIKFFHYIVIKQQFTEQVAMFCFERFDVISRSYLLTTRVIISGSLNLMTRSVGITSSMIWILSKRTKTISKKPRIKFITLTSLWFCSSIIFSFPNITLCSIWSGNKSAPFCRAINDAVCKQVYII